MWVPAAAAPRLVFRELCFVPEFPVRPSRLSGRRRTQFFWSYALDTPAVPRAPTVVVRASDMKEWYDITGNDDFTKQA